MSLQEILKGTLRKGLITTGIAGSLILGCNGDDITKPPPPPPPENRAPVITSNPLIQINESSSYGYQITANDPDGDKLTYTLTEKPSWLSISGNRVSGTAPEVLEDTSFPVRVRVSDGKASVEQAYNLTVNNLFNTYVLSSNQINNLSEVRDNSLIFSNPVDFSPKDIVASDINNKIPYGLLREITSISSNKKTLQTRQATLEQVVREASLSFSRILRPSDVQSSTSKSGVVMSPATTQDFNFNIRLTNVVLFDLDRNLNTTYDQLIANGNIAFDTDFIFDLDISNHRLSNLDFRNTTNIEADVTLGSNIAGIAQTARIKIAEYNFHPFIAGYLPTPVPIPVVVLPTLGVYVGLDPTRINPFGVRVEQNATLNAGIIYDGGWEGIADFSNNFDFSIPVVQGDWELSAYVGPSLELMLYGIAGPFVGISARLRLESQDGGWKLYGGLGTILGVKMEVLKRGVSAQFRQVINNEKLLAESGINQEPTDTLIIQPGQEGKDAYVEINIFQNGDISYSGVDASYLDVDKYIPGGIGWIDETLIQFPLSSIPSGVNINSANLKLYGQGSFIGGTSIVKVKKILEAWDESTVKWDTKPTYGDYVSSSTLTDEIKWHEWDITSLVQEWINGGVNYGLALLTTSHRPTGETGGFRSSDNSDSTKRPILEVLYH